MERVMQRRSAPPVRRLVMLYLGTSSGVLALRYRRGVWSPLQHGLVGQAISALTVVPDQPETLYASNGSELYLSTDSGLHWRPLGAPQAGTPIRALLALSRSQTAIIAGLAGAAIVCGNGSHWRPAELPAALEGEVTQVLPTTGEPSHLYALVGHHLLSSLNAGATWQSLDPPMSVTCLALHPDSPATLYAGSPTGLWRTRNAGRNWQRLSSQPVTAVLVHPARPRTVIVAQAEGLQQSLSGGSNWQPMPGSPTAPDDPVVQLIGQAYQELILATTQRGQLLQLIDGQWQPPLLGPLPPVLGIVIGIGDGAPAASTLKRPPARRKRQPRRESGPAEASVAPTARQPGASGERPPLQPDYHEASE